VGAADLTLNFGSLAGIVQAIKGSEMVARAVRQSGGAALVSPLHVAASRF